MQIGYLDGPRLRRALLAACNHAQSARGELNRINVFPVPDGDTGTNLALTVRAIADRLRRNADRAVGAVAADAAEAAVLGARGNCGMMLSHFLLGFAERFAGQVRVDAREFAEALRAGASTLRSALERPVEGTILTVMQETADAAGAAATPDFAPLVETLVEEAEASLARTPDALPVLREAGVVDAGAKGFVELLEGVRLYIRGRSELADAVSPASEGAAAVARVEFPGASERYRYCTEALVRGPDLPDQAGVRAALRDRGDSLIVVRTGRVLKVHVHTDEPEGVFAYLRTLGRLVTHKAEDMEAQHATVERAAGRHVGLARRPVAVLTDSAADLPDEIVRAHGIHVVPLLMVAGDEVLRDGIDISAEEFHRRLASRGSVLPTTSQPAPADFLRGMAAAAEEGEAVVGVIVGSSLSGTFGSAEAAAWRFEEAPVHLADSLGASLLQGLLVLKACELAEMAVDPAEIVAEVARIRRASGILFTVDRFDRLRASGRVGMGGALLGRLSRLKPVLELDPDGKVAAIGKAFGRRRARARLLDALAERVPPGGAAARFGIVHVGAPEVADSVAETLRMRYGGDVEILTAPATPVISTHLGIGAWGVAYMLEDGDA